MRALLDLGQRGANGQRDTLGPSVGNRASATAKPEEDPLMIDLAIRRDSLVKRLASLDEKLHQIEEELESHQSKDWEEMATEREGDEVLEGMGVSGQHEIRMIKAALQRMDEGEYGTCMKCGDDISEDRLDVLPWTPFCRKCAT
jgi:RNA polymerase-binding transcription factor DksA